MRCTARLWSVMITVEGLNTDRFLRNAGAHRIRLTDVRRISNRRVTAMIWENMLPALQEIALQGGWKLSVGNRKGIGRLVDWLRRRWLLTSAVLIGCIALSAASQVMWQIDIENGGTYEADIRIALDEMGVIPPKMRSQIDIGELRDALEWRYPRIAWLECGWRGTTLVIRPVEGVLPRSDGKNDGPSDLVADRDGVIESVVTRAGTPVVKAGDIVRKGDVLIKGEERTSEGGVHPVAARGVVTARVWRGASVRMSAVERMTSYTGNTQTVWTIRTPWFDLWPLETCGFENNDTSISQTQISSCFIPMMLHIETRMEAEVALHRCDVEELKRSAYEAAAQKLQKMVGLDESLIDIWGNCSMIDAETIVSVAIAEMQVEIGTRASASGMAAPGQNNSESR